MHFAALNQARIFLIPCDSSYSTYRRLKPSGGGSFCEPIIPNPFRQEHTLALELIEEDYSDSNPTEPEDRATFQLPTA